MKDVGYEAGEPGFVLAWVVPGTIIVELYFLGVYKKGFEVLDG